MGADYEKKVASWEEMGDSDSPKVVTATEEESVEDVTEEAISATNLEEEETTKDVTEEVIASEAALIEAVAPMSYWQKRSLNANGYASETSSEIAPEATIEDKNCCGSECCCCSSDCDCEEDEEVEPIPEPKENIAKVIIKKLFGKLFN